MISLLEGRPGGGKTYEAVVYHILPVLLQDKRQVITNVPLNVEMFRKIFGNTIADLIVILNVDREEGIYPFNTVDYFKTEWRNDKGQGPFFVIDEAHEVLRKGLTLEEKRNIQKICDFAAVHRHFVQDWLLITQFAKKLHPEIVCLIEASFFVSKSMMWGSGKTYRRSSYIGERDKVNFIKQDKRKYYSKFFPFYKSHSMIAGKAIEAKPHDTKLSFKHLIAIFVVAVSILVFFSYKTYKVLTFSSFAQAKEVEIKTPLKPVVKVEPKKEEKKEEKPPEDELITVLQPKKEIYQREPEKTVDQVMRAPFDDFSFHLKAKIQGKNKQVYLFGATKGTTEIDVTGEELGKVGYSIREITNCILIVDHKYTKQSRYVYCKKTLDGEKGIIPISFSATAQ